MPKDEWESEYRVRCHFCTHVVRFKATSLGSQQAADLLADQGGKEKYEAHIKKKHPNEYKNLMQKS